MFGPLAIDASLLNPTFYRNGGQYDGTSWSWARVGAYYFSSAEANGSLYWGGGVAATTVNLPRSGSVSDWGGMGASIDVTAGYEIARLDARRYFVEMNLSLPTYRMESRSYDTLSTGTASQKYGPQIELSIGVGWGQPREIWALSDARRQANAPSSSEPRQWAPAASDSGNGRVAYFLRARTPAKRFEIRDVSNNVVGRCVESCTLQLAPGAYELSPIDVDGQRDPGTAFEVSDPGSCEFEDASSSTATAGLILGIGGPLMTLAGVAMVATQICIDCEGSESRSPFIGYTGIGVAIAGLVLTPIGWILYATHRRPRIIDAPASTRSGVMDNVSSNAAPSLKLRF